MAALGRMLPVGALDNLVKCDMMINYSPVGADLSFIT